MTILRAPTFRPAALASVLSFIGILSCGREITAPGGRGRQAEIALNPVFGTVRLGGTGEVLSIGSVVDFVKVRIVLLRTNGDTAVNRVIAFPPDSTSIRIAFNVILGDATTSQGEPFTATMKYINAADDTVFSGGPLQVIARPPGSTPQNPPEIPIIYVGPGANAAGLTIAPVSFTGTINQQQTFTSVVLDGQGSPIANVPVAYTSTDSSRVSVNLRTGGATLIGARGTANIIAQTLTGQADTAPVTITPTPTAIVLVSGGNQQVRQGLPFPALVTVRVNAVDGIGVAGVPVVFSVQRGQGTTNPAVDTTDVNGFADATWTAGDSAGAAILRATVGASAILINVSGQQLSSAPTSLIFGSQPANFTAGDTIPPFTVTVRDESSATVLGYNGNVALSLSGGTAGAGIVGASTVAAVSGVASFSDLTVNRGGVNYRLIATVAGAPPAQSNLFTVAPSVPRTVIVVGGANQTAPASTVLPDSAKVRVSDVFGFPKAGVTVLWTVAQGGGTVSPASSVTDSAGRAATRWTIGATGTQQITATAGALQPVPISASVFSPQGTPTLFVSVDQVSTVIGGVRTVPVFISPAAGVPITASLVVRDTLIAKWQSDSIVFPALASLRSPGLVGRALGGTYAVISSNAGTDSVFVSVDSAFLQLSGSSYVYAAVGDTLRKQIELSEPAPVGGITVIAVSSDPLTIKVAPASGRGAPTDECDYYCYGLRLATPSILATPAETAFVTIPAGQTVGQLAVFPLDPEMGSATVTVRAAGYASATTTVYVAARQLLNYPTFGTYSTPMAVGQQKWLTVYTNNPAIRDIRVRLTSRNPAAVRVDSVATIPRGNTSSDYVRYDGLSPDSTWIVIEADGYPTDSVQAIVGVPYLRITDVGVDVAAGSSYPLTVYTSTDSLSGSFFYYDPPRAADLPITVSSSDTSVVIPDDLSRSIRAGDQYVQIPIRGVAVGSAWVRVVSPGVVTDSVFVTVSGQTLQVVDANFQVGVGQVSTSINVYRSGSGTPASVAYAVNITSSDPSVATVLTPQVNLVGGGLSYDVRILGRAAGQVTLTFSAVGFAPVVRTFNVSVPSFTFGSFATSTDVDADSTSYAIFAYAQDAIGSIHEVSDTLVAVLRSSNPSQLLVTDSILRIYPGAYYSTSGSYRMIAPGSAQLSLVAPGYTTAFSGVFTIRPFRLDLLSDVVTTGVGLELPLIVSRRSPRGAVLPFTVTVRGPAGVTAKAPVDSFPAGVGSLSILVRSGSTTGTDTVIVSAAGNAPDTVQVNVTTSRAQPNLSESALVGQETEVTAYLRPTPTYTYLSPAIPVRLVVSLADSTIGRVLTDTIRFVAGSDTPVQFGNVRWTRPGVTYVRTTDPTGLFASDSQYVYVYPQQLYGSQSRVLLGMSQRTDVSELYVYRDYSNNDSLWVTFTSSAPSVATVTDSVLIAPGTSYGYFEITSGDSVGGATITGRAQGLLDVRFQTEVTRGEIQTYLDNSVLRPGETTRLSVYPIDARSRENHVSTIAIPLRLSSEDPNVASVGADSLTVIDADTYVTAVGRIAGTGLGRADIVVEDRRTGSFQQYLPGRDRLTVTAGRLEASARRYDLGVGLRRGGSNDYILTGSDDSVRVQMRSLAGRVKFDSDSMLVYSYGAFTMSGVSAGTDTLVFSAPGYVPDSVIATVGDGLLRSYSNVPSRIRQGDSVFVTFSLVDPSQQEAFLAVPSRLLTISSAGSIQALAAAGGGSVLTTLTLTAGDYQFSLWLKATGGGGGTIDITGPNLLAFRAVVDTRPLP